MYNNFKKSRQSRYRASIENILNIFIKIYFLKIHFFILQLQISENPDTINHLTDFKDIYVDTVTKAGYVPVIHIVDRMNAT